MIRDALEWLEGGERWHKGEMYGPNNTACIYGALFETKNKNCRIVTNVALAQYPDRIELNNNKIYLAQFNDHPDTVWADVERVMEKGAVQEEELI